MESSPSRSAPALTKTADAPPVAAPSPPASRPIVSKPVFALSVMVCAAACAAAGFYWGKASRPVIPLSPALTTTAITSPISPKNEEEVTTPPTIEVPEEMVETPVELNEPGQLSAKSTLISFLDAADWKSRSSYVLFPGDHLEAMEARSMELGDAPIQTTGIRLFRKEASTYIYWIGTPDIPEGFPVAVVTTDQGPKVVWESFVSFHDDLFQKFVDGPTDQHAILHLLVKPGAPTTPESSYRRFQLSVPMPGRNTEGYIRKDALALARLNSLFNGAGGYSKAIIDELIKADGLPLILALVKRETNDGRSFIEIEDFVAAGWAPPQG